MKRLVEQGGRWGSAGKQPPHRPDSARAPGLRARGVALAWYRRPTCPARRFPMATRTGVRNLFARSPRTAGKAPARFRPLLEALEDRLAPATLVVNSTAD